MSAENEVIMEVADPKDRLARLQSQELEIGSQLSPNQYAEMLLGLLVQGRFIQAKHCYSRSNQRFPEFPLAKQIWTFGEHICKQNFALALKILKNMELIEPTLQLYIDELKKRLVAEQLQHIAGTYSSINTFKFSQLLGSPDSLDEVMPLCLWTLTDDHFVLPVNNVQLSRTLSALSNPSFGPAISKAGSHQADNQKREIDSLAQLASCSTFFDAMSTKAAFASNAANANNPIN